MKPFNKMPTDLSKKAKEILDQMTKINSLMMVVRRRTSKCIRNMLCKRLKQNSR